MRIQEYSKSQHMYSGNENTAIFRITTYVVWKWKYRNIQNHNICTLEIKIQEYSKSQHMYYGKLCTFPVLFLIYVRNVLFRVSNSSRSQWPPGLRPEMSSPARILGSWARISLEAWVFVRVYCVYMFCVGSDLANGWSPVQWVLTTVYKIKKLEWNGAFRRCHMLQYEFIYIYCMCLTEVIRYTSSSQRKQIQISL
jgi:hypothetical protein